MSFSFAFYTGHVNELFIYLLTCTYCSLALTSVLYTL